jgi:hypothetical protein
LCTAVVELMVDDTCCVLLRVSVMILPFVSKMPFVAN